MSLVKTQLKRSNTAATSAEGLAIDTAALRRLKARTEFLQLLTERCLLDSENMKEEQERAAEVLHVDLEIGILYRWYLDKDELYDFQLVKCISTS